MVDLEIRVDAESGRGRVVALQLRAPEGEQLTYNALRGVALSKLVRQAVAGASHRIDAGKTGHRAILGSIVGKTYERAKADAAFYDRYCCPPRSLTT